MLTTFFGKKSEHPLADIKSAQSLIDDLPKNDAYRSLADLTDLVESLHENGDFKLDHQFAVLRLLDESAQPFVRKLAREYFTPFEISKFQENRLWMALSNWSHRIATAYFTLFSAYCNGEKGSAAIKAHLPLLAARTVHALMWKLKYVCAHYGKTDETFWPSLLQLYKHAEQNQYLAAPVSLYSGFAGNTSVKQELGHLMVWHDAGLSALSPMYIHLTERLVANYGATIDIRVQLDQHSRLCFDLNRPAEPTRVNAGATTHPSMRFVGMPEMKAKLEDLLKVLNKDIVPNDINLGGTYDAEVLKEAVQYLLNYVVAPPVRRNTRRTADVTLSIVNGFEQVIQSTEAWLGFEEVEKMHWVTEEISANGFSCKIPVKGSEGIGIGSLLGMQPEGVPHWGVAVVRRLLRDDSDQLRVGAEILSTQVASVMLNQNKVAGGTMENGQSALWLYSRQNDTTGEVQLLMRADTFSAGRSLQIHLSGKNYLLMPNGLQEKGLDYDLAKFRFAVQEAASTEAV
ncbi:MAG: hypothetical protein HY938_11575 [Nitrosomonadales bacterium]|nr:hypothetical protein [Nitrosomonadales bacterium]